MKHARLISSVVLFASSFLALIAAANPSWTLLGPSGLTYPLFRSGSTSVYDPSSNRIILFAGLSDDAAAGDPRLNDVWVETNANGLGGTGAWSNLIPSGSPQVRSDHSAVYDAASRTVAVINGLGRRNTTVYDAAGRPIASINPLGNRATNVYDVRTHSSTCCHQE